MGTHVGHIFEQPRIVASVSLRAEAPQASKVSSHLLTFSERLPDFRLPGGKSNVTSPVSRLGLGMNLMPLPLLLADAPLRTPRA